MNKLRPDRPESKSYCCLRCAKLQIHYCVPAHLSPYHTADLKVAVWLDVDFQAKHAVDPMTLLACQLVEGFG